METALPPLLSAIEASKARDAALQQVSDNSGDWMALALIELAEMARLPSGWANLDHGFTGEDMRRMIVPLCGNPHHNNAFGALVRTAITRKIIEPAGAYRAMRAEGSHGRKTPVYRWMCVR